MASTFKYWLFINGGFVLAAIISSVVLRVSPDLFMILLIGQLLFSQLIVWLAAQRLAK